MRTAAAEAHRLARAKRMAVQPRRHGSAAVHVGRYFETFGPADAVMQNTENGIGAILRTPGPFASGERRRLADLVRLRRILRDTAGVAPGIAERKLMQQIRAKHERG